MKIGIFDSGMGGLSVLHCAKKMLRETHFIFYADEDHVPYGEKSREELRGYITRALNYLVERRVDAIVIACNTATSIATPEFRQKFPVPIVGMEPAVKKAVELYGTERRRILVAATPVTVNGPKLQALLERVDAEHDADTVALPGLVRLAERGDFSSAAVSSYLRDALSSYDLAAYGTLVLGCTHFNYFKDTFKKIFPCPIHFVDGNLGTVQQLKRVLQVEDATPAPDRHCCDYVFSGRPVSRAARERIAACLRQLDAVFHL